MISLQLWIFVAMLVAIIGKGLIKPARFFEFPYFMAATFAIFVLPQVISFRSFPGSAPLESIPMVLLMTNLCLASCYFGHLLPPSRWIVRHSNTPVNLDRLLHVGAVFVFVSFFFTYLITRMTTAETGGTQWSGRVTIYHFFASLASPALSICLIVAIRRRSAMAWILTGLASVIPLYSIIFYGRREGATVFVLTIALTLFYFRRAIPPRLAVIGAIGFAMLAIPATGTFRGAMSTGGFDAAKQIDIIGNFQRFLNEESILELRNAAVLIYTTRLYDTYEFGAGYWDELVFRFVPAQIVGAETKASLMLGRTRIKDDGEDEGIEIGIRNYTAPKGSTVTGMGDSFREFGYFGCLFFALMAIIFRSLWETSLQPEAYFAKLLYILTATSAMRAVTHQTSDFLPGLLYNLIFLGLAVLYARKGKVPLRTPPASILPSSISGPEVTGIVNTEPQNVPAPGLPLTKKRDIDLLIVPASSPRNKSDSSSPPPSPRRKKPDPSA
jgi:hypothetical protein